MRLENHLFEVLSSIFLCKKPYLQIWTRRCESLRIFRLPFKLFLCPLYGPLPVAPWKLQLKRTGGTLLGKSVFSLSALNRSQMSLRGLCVLIGVRRVLAQGLDHCWYHGDSLNIRQTQQSTVRRRSGCDRTSKHVTGIAATARLQQRSLIHGFMNSVTRLLAWVLQV